MKHRKGSILGLASIVLVCLLLLTVPWLMHLSTEYQSASKSKKAVSSVSLAEAGVEMAIWELNRGDIETWQHIDNLRVKSEEIGDGDYYVKVDISNPEQIMLESMGSSPWIADYTVPSRVVVELKKGEINAFEYAVFGEDGVHLDSNVVIDSFDSRLGEYGEDNIGANGNVGTTSTEIDAVTINTNAEIHGDIHSGVDSNPNDVVDIQGNAVVTGEISPLTIQPELPAISAPEGLEWRGSFYDSGGELTISESGEFSDFILDSGAIITIDGDVTLYVSGEFQLNSNTQLNIATGASLKLYLGTDFTQSSNSQINNLTKDSTSLVIIGTDTMTGDIEMNSSADFYGAIYASKANILMNSNAEIYGAVIAKSVVSIESNARVHYDEALAGLSVGESQFYVVHSWHQIH